MTTAEQGAAEPPAPPWRRDRRGASAGRPPRRPLSQDLIIDAALRIVRDEGLDGVSMRRVAQDLGTGPASLYAHVSGKEELLELVLDRVAGEIRLPEPDPARWQEQLKEIAREARRVWRNHRDISLVSLGSGVPTGRNQLLVAERMLAIMLAGGVPERVAAWALDRLGLYVDADCYEGAIYAARLEGQDIASFWAEYIPQILDYFRSLPPDTFPLISSMGEILSGGGDDDRFEFGLDLLVRGLASYVTG